MTPHANALLNGDTRVVGSFGGRQDLLATADDTAHECCDIAEVRLDLLTGGLREEQAKPWQHLTLPLLFTARRIEEGGAQPLSAEQRMDLLHAALKDAALIDIEVASIAEMEPLLESLQHSQQPWIASYHDFGKLPEESILLEAIELAKAAGAHAFKLAAFLDGSAALARLAEFQRHDHGLPVSTMGMGPLAPVSRLLCAQAGSVLNYGYIGSTPTAPGQWDAALLKQAIGRLGEWPVTQ